MATTFRKLNSGWNAEPNAPDPKVNMRGDDCVLRFKPNHFVFQEYEDVGFIELTFKGCSRYRLGKTNDEGWYRGQCRFSKLAPAWGEFYEVGGDLYDHTLDDWVQNESVRGLATVRYLFYFRDETFECDANGWEKRDVA